MVIFLALFYVANLFSPPPPSAAAVGWAFLLWLLVPWAHWFDRRRQVTAARH